MNGTDFGLRKMKARERDLLIRRLSEEWWMQPTADNGWEGCFVLGGRCGLPLKRIWAAEWTDSTGTVRRQVSFSCQCCGTVHTISRIWNDYAKQWTPPLWKEHEAKPVHVTAAGIKYLTSHPGGTIPENVGHFRDDIIKR